MISTYFHRLREECRNRAPRGTDYVAAISGCEIEYFQRGNGDKLLEYKNGAWVASSLKADELTPLKFDMVMEI